MQGYSDLLLHLVLHIWSMGWHTCCCCSGGDSVHGQILFICPLSLLLLLQLPAVCTLTLFLSSLLVLMAPHSMLLPRLWVCTGLVWMLSAWFTFLVQNFTDKSDVWLSICLVRQNMHQASQYSPFLLSDPDFGFCSDCWSPCLCD